ncbi:MAG TPA: metal ABC transporter ATP-binding protein [Thermoanaerobaculia bacterium]|nr:metal ABC transporter ATP-binding protein [Thermoanaerobaculia bacterium]
MSERIAASKYAFVLRAERLGLGYHHRALAEDLTFQVRRREILGIVGPNGCGKTTLLRTLLGILKPVRGTVERDPSLAASYVPQHENIDTILPITALEVVLLGHMARESAFRRLGAADRRVALEALRRVGADTLGPQLFRDLSGGQQRRVLLARALAAEPDLLVLDEPTAGMDVAGEAAIIDFLRDLNQAQGMTILIVTHLLSLVLNFATSILLMTASGTIVHGPIEDVLREDRLSELYGVPIRLGRVGGQRMLAVDRQGAGDV